MTELFLMLLLSVAVGGFLFMVMRSLGRNAAGAEDIFDVVSVETVACAGGGFREPANETEFREVFERLAGRLYGYRVSVSQERCPDLLLYDKVAKKTVRAEVEYRASDFFRHKHKFDSVDLIVCWTNDLKESHIPILECKKKIRKYYCGP